MAFCSHNVRLTFFNESVEDAMARPRNLVNTLIKNSEKARSYDFSFVVEAPESQENGVKKFGIEGLIHRKKNSEEARPSYTFAL